MSSKYRPSDDESSGSTHDEDSDDSNFHTSDGEVMADVDVEDGVKGGKVWKARRRKRSRKSNRDSYESDSSGSIDSEKGIKTHFGFDLESIPYESVEAEKILFYGDSLTWGMAHDCASRYPVTWPRLLEGKLKEYNLEVVESALCSRTTVWDDPGNEVWMTGAEGHMFNGRDHFVIEFQSCLPSWLVILLGTNDLRERVRKRAKSLKSSRTRVIAQDIADNAGSIGLVARKVHAESPLAQGDLNVVIVCPPIVHLNANAEALGYDRESVVLSRAFPKAFQKMCKQNKFLFVNPGLDSTTFVDGIHFDDNANQECADAVWRVIQPRLRASPNDGPKQISRGTSVASRSSGAGNRSPVSKKNRAPKPVSRPVDRATTPQAKKKKTATNTAPAPAPAAPGAESRTVGTPTTPQAKKMKTATNTTPDPAPATPGEESRTVGTPTTTQAKKKKTATNTAPAAPSADPHTEFCVNVAKALKKSKGKDPILSKFCNKLQTLHETVRGDTVLEELQSLRTMLEGWMRYKPLLAEFNSIFPDPTDNPKD